jgi:SAM-dependent methyltransferase
MELLNLGCGYKYVSGSGWLNVDLSPATSEVKKCNFLHGIPFESNRFDLVYSSHVLEHFKKEDGEMFIRECFRVCKSGGRIRIVLPDLEKIAREYLNQLELSVSGDEEAQWNYDWIMLEMYDQAVRSTAGGGMSQYLAKPDGWNFSYVEKRIGPLSQFVGRVRSRTEETRAPQNLKFLFTRSMRRLLLSFGDVLRRIILGKRGFYYYCNGRFRAGGEIHQWMYDRYSLSRLLTKSGFTDIKVFSADTSGMENWRKFGLDDCNESASLYIEGRK